MLNLERIVISILFILVAVLTWFGYHRGVDNLPVLLTVGGGIAFAFVGNGSGENDNGILACIVLIVVGTIFAMTGAGFLVGVALFFAGVLGAIGGSMALNG